MRECKDICRLFDRISFGFGGKRYQGENKFCSVCGKFLKINGYKCGCCGTQVRCNSHTKRWKKSQRIGDIEI